MGNTEIIQIAEGWKNLAVKARNAEHVTYSELYEAYRSMFREFVGLRKSNEVPREALQAIMLMDEFTYYAAICDENYMEEIRSGIFYLNYALKNDFFKGDYKSSFFLGTDYENVKKYELDIEKVSYEDFVSFMKDVENMDFTELVLNGFDV